MTATFRVGLTGGLASGKSTVATALKQAGFTVIDSDKLVAALYLPDNDGTKAVAELFGEDMLSSAGAVDHAKLAREVFANPRSRAQLERAIHPLVQRDFEAALADSSGVIVLEATLLVESGMADSFDFVVSLEATVETQLARAMSRGLTESEARARLEAQLSSRELRRARADYLLWNDGNRAELETKIEDLILRINALHLKKTGANR